MSDHCPPIQQVLLDVPAGNNPRYRSWLTYVPRTESHQRETAKCGGTNRKGNAYI